MSVKDSLVSGLGKVMQSEQAMKLMQNEALMKAVMKAFTVSTELRQVVDGQVRTVVRSLNLVTRDELKGLRRTLERLERELADLQMRTDDAVVQAAEAAEAARMYTASAEDLYTQKAGGEAEASTEESAEASAEE